MCLLQVAYDHGPPAVAQACEWVRQAAAGVRAAHDRNLVHRDLKPSNLLLTPDGVVKLADLGLAKLYHGDEEPELVGASAD